MAAADGKIKIGKNTLVYYSTSITGPLADRTWVAYGKVQDCKKKTSFGKIEIAEYDTDDIKFLRGHKTTDVTLKISRRPGHAGYDALEDAHENGTPIGLAFVTHGAAIDEEGARGWWGDVEIFDWDEDTGKDGNSVDLALALTANSSLPAAKFEIV